VATADPDVIDGETVLPGFSLALQEFFAPA
jgi:hypothetical protein